MKAAEKRQLGTGNQRADIWFGKNRKKNRQLLMMSFAYCSIISAFI
jgi:hypothetical protein